MGISKNLKNCHCAAKRSILMPISLVLLLLCQTSPAQIGRFTLHMSDGVDLEAFITTPISLPPSGGFPSLVLVHGFGGSLDDMLPLAISMAVYGYASIAYSVRGQGSSGGLSTVCGARERQDLLEVIQYFRNLAFINPNKLGVSGGSQGGIHSWMAAVYRMPGVRAVVPLIATPDFARTLVPNGCIKYGLPREMSLSTVRYSSDRDRVRDFIVADQHDSVLTYIDARDIAHLVDSVQIPVLQGLGWADFIFPANGGIAAARQLAACHIPIWSYYGTNGHGEPFDPVEAAFVANKTVNWFDHWLKGFSLGQDSIPMVFYSDDRSGWPHHTSTVWPPQPYNILRLYITQDGLSRLPPTGSAAIPFSLIYDSSYTPRMAWDNLYGGPAFVNAFTSTPARLLSNVFEIDVEVTGIPTGQIFVQSDAGKFQAHVVFYDVMTVDTGRVWRVMSRSVNGIRQNTVGQVHQIAIEGTALSHIVPAGHRIGIEVTSLDMLNPGQANTVPYFLSTHSQLLASTSSVSYVEIPMVGAFPVMVADRGPAFPQKLTLSQNYPNPFNPTTTIRYALPKDAFVTLKVYNLLGQEVTSLRDEMQNVGFHDVVWNGRNNAGQTVASGVYFYRLEARPLDGAEPFTSFKKMLMLK